MRGRGQTAEPAARQERDALEYLRCDINYLIAQSITPHLPAAIAFIERGGVFVIVNGRKDKPDPRIANAGHPTGCASPQWFEKPPTQASGCAPRRAGGLHRAAPSLLQPCESSSARHPRKA